MSEPVLDIETRTMGADDLDDILAIERVSFSIPWSRDIFMGEIEHPLCHDLVARVEGQIAGYISFAIVHDEIHLRNLAVHRDWKRHGVASRLLSRMITISSAEGARYGTLEVRKGNVAAIELYKRFGFVVKGVRPSYYSETCEDALIMWADFGL